MLFWRPRDLSVVNVVRPWKLVSRSAIATPSLVQMQPWLLDFESHGSPVFHTKNSKESCFLKGVMFIVWKLHGWLQKSFLQQTKETNWEMEAQKELQEKRCWRQPVGADLCGEACVVWGLQFMSLLRNQTWFQWEHRLDPKLSINERLPSSHMWIHQWGWRMTTSLCPLEKPKLPKHRGRANGWRW